MKNTLSKFIIISSVLLTPLSGAAQQNFTCGTQAKINQVYAAYPGLEADQQALLENSAHYMQDRDDSVYTIYIIPVVFHVIHEYGTENIDDSQIYDQMEILNLDFRKLNPDTNEIVAPFDTLAADAHIQFRLAALDPFGNCTNGIEHINSHETRVGDDPSKLHQWPRSRYLNVWVVKTMEDGVAGYAYYPSAVSGGMYYADGIIIRNNYIGSIGTSDDYSSRALTHEIGHYLGLPHVWGSTNDPGVACGNDGIADTPITAGHETCVLTGTDNCNPGIPENIQNFMEYSYCSRMYTYGQVGVMRTSLENPISGRDNLHTDLNHTLTGIDDVTVPVCAPMADFYANKQTVCAGGSVTYTSASWQAPVTSYSWHFVGGTPEFSTDNNPTVTYAEAGTFEVSLTVSNGTGSNTKTVTQAIIVQGDWWDHVGPYSESFEAGALPVHYYAINPEDDQTTFDVYENVGFTGNHAAGVIYYRDDLDPILDLNYYQRLGAGKEILITDVFNLNNTTGSELTFKYAHATTTGGLFDGEGLNLKVSYSTNCGGTWTLLQNLQEMDVLSAGYKGTYFSPTNTSDWYGSSVTLPNAAMELQVRFKFEFTAADYSNNFYLDDINVTGVLLTPENSLEITNVSVYPNPVTNASNVNVAFSLLASENVNIVMYDMLGNAVLSKDIAGVQGANTLEIPMSEYNLSAGVYTVSVVTESGTKTVKLNVR